jgi:prophage antirepressor-like protein
MSVWVVGKDLCNVLGYKDPTTAMRSHCRGVQKLHPIVDSLGRTQEVRIINQADVLRLIVNSTLPAAQRIEAWIFEEVVPMVLKTGSYTIPGHEWKELSAAKATVLLRAYNQGIMTTNEFRRKVLNLPPFEIDAPLERPGKEARKTKTEEKYYPSDELLKFVDDNLDFTSNVDDFIRLADLYARYILQVKTPLSRWTFIHTMKGSFNIISRQKKIGGYPTLVFIGCKFKPVKESALLSNK